VKEMTRINPIRMRNLSKAIKRSKPDIDTSCSAKYFSIDHLSERNAPFLKRDYRNMLYDAGQVERVFRSIVNLSLGDSRTKPAPFSNLRINTVSTFMNRPYLFLPFADSHSFDMFDPSEKHDQQRFSGKMVERFEFLPEKSGKFLSERLKNHMRVFHEYYFLSGIRPADIVLSSLSCDCCFAGKYIDQVKAGILDLQNKGSMLLMNAHFSHNETTEFIANPVFIKWMQEAGFEVTWFLAMFPPVFPNLRIPELDRLYPFKADEFKYVTDKLNFLAEKKRVPYWDFGLYLAVQRITNPGRDIIERVLQEVVEWENINLVSRKTRAMKKDQIQPAKKLFKQFEQSIPQLLDSLYN